MLEGRDVWLMVRGDDFVCLSAGDGCDFVAETFKSRYDIKVRARLGPTATDDKDIRILNRSVQWVGDGIEYESDLRHAEIIIQSGAGNSHGPVDFGSQAVTERADGRFQASRSRAH